MNTVRITGWEEGFNKVAFNRLLRAKTGCGLSDAKRAVDRLLNGESLLIDVEHALEFCKDADALGAMCSLNEHPPAGN